MFNLNNSKIIKLSKNSVKDIQKIENFENVGTDVNPLATSAPITYTPIQIQTAYGLNLIPLQNGKTLGSGIKIAIIIAYHYANLQPDLNTYCNKYKLAPITLTIINQAGNITDKGWALECNLDTQMINTIAPGAKVYVVEAKTNSFNDLQTAITTAVNLGVDIISMSFGSSEFLAQSSLEHLFTSSNITFIASSGDAIYPNYPATSSNVVAVGGTTLTLNSNNTRKTEITWAYAGVGPSKYTLTPIYQKGVNSTKYRNIPDVSLTGSTADGFVVYSSVNGGYFSVGGTSVSAPLFAGITSVANQLRKNASKPLLTSISTSSTCLQTYLYKTIYTSQQLYSTCMYDITSGSDGSYTAVVNYDMATGLGSVNSNTLCSQLVNV